MKEIYRLPPQKGRRILLTWIRGDSAESENKVLELRPSILNFIVWNKRKGLLS